MRSGTTGAVIAVVTKAVVGAGRLSPSLAASTLKKSGVVVRFILEISSKFRRGSCLCLVAWGNGSASVTAVLQEYQSTCHERLIEDDTCICHI
jgi:hypothetical protein